MNDIDAVLFDLGQVVLDLEVERCFAYWAQAAGEETDVLVSRWTTDEHYKDHEIGGQDFETYTRALSSNLGITLSVEDWRAGWNALFVGVFEGVARRLPQLAQTLPIYGFTNTNAVHQREWSTRFAAELAPFEKIYVSSEIGMRKPDAHAYRWVVDDMRTVPERVLFLDDNAENITGAQDVGLKTVHVRAADDAVAAIDVFLNR
jgi:putative hydrolase of the HAD superfamily